MPYGLVHLYTTAYAYMVRKLSHRLGLRYVLTAYVVRKLSHRPYNLSNIGVGPTGHLSDPQ